MNHSHLRVSGTAWHSHSVLMYSFRLSHWKPYLAWFLAARKVEPGRATYSVAVELLEMHVLLGTADLSEHLLHGPKRHTAEEIIGKLREVEIRIAQGVLASEAIRGIGVTEQTCYRWRRAYSFASAVFQAPSRTRRRQACDTAKRSPIALTSLARC